MKNKLVLLSGVAVGYVLGTRAGREQYEKIKSQAQSLWNNPKVQEQVSHAQETVKQQAPVVGEKLGEVTRKATDHAKPSGRGGDEGVGTAGGDLGTRNLGTTGNAGTTGTGTTGTGYAEESGSGI